MVIIPHLPALFTNRWEQRAPYLLKQGLTTYGLQMGSGLQNHGFCLWSWGFGSAQQQSLGGIEWQVVLCYTIARQLGSWELCPGCTAAE